jgi:hypothetical protein
MPYILPITLSLAVVVLTVFLVLLLIQARRTAAAVERLAESAVRDLHQVSVDIHEVRMRADEMADLAKNTLALPSTLTQVVSGIVRGMPAFFTRRSSGGNIFSTLMTGIQTVLHLFRTSNPTPPKEDPHE